MVQQRWQWQHCNITVHTSVTVGDNWECCDSGGTESVVSSSVNWQHCDSDVHISVTVMCTSLWKWWQLTALSQHCQVPSLSHQCAHRYLSTVTSTVVTTLCLFSLPQRCARFRCHSAVLVFAVTTLCSFWLSQRCARFRCHNAVLVFAATTLCTLISNRCWIPPV